MNSYIYEFKDLPSTDIPYNAETFTAMQNKLLDSIYPIGSIMIKDDATDYSSYLGFTWEKVFAGVTLVGLDTTQTEFDTIGKTGGEKTHTLTESEMPTHKHKTRYAGGKYATGGQGSGYASCAEYASVATRNETDHFVGENTGGNQPHNILQPYQVVAYWKRVA